MDKRLTIGIALLALLLLPAISAREGIFDPSMPESERALLRAPRTQEMVEAHYYRLSWGMVYAGREGCVNRTEFNVGYNEQMFYVNLTCPYLDCYQLLYESTERLYDVVRVYSDADRLIKRYKYLLILEAPEGYFSNGQISDVARLTENIVEYDCTDSVEVVDFREDFGHYRFSVQGTGAKGACVLTIEEQIKYRTDYWNSPATDVPKEIRCGHEWNRCGHIVK